MLDSYFMKHQNNILLLPTALYQKASDTHNKKAKREYLVTFLSVAI